MKKCFPLTLMVLIASLPALAQASSATASFAWEKSVVKIEVARKAYDYYQPWNRRNDRAAKTGIVVGERQILVTAQDLSDQTLVRVQKNGRGKWTTASVVWIDYHANLALLTTEDAAFWSDLRSANLTGKPPGENDPLQIVRWRAREEERGDRRAIAYLNNSAYLTLGIDSTQRPWDGECHVRARRVAVSSPIVGIIREILDAMAIHHAD